MTESIGLGQRSEVSAHPIRSKRCGEYQSTGAPEGVRETMVVGFVNSLWSSLQGKPHKDKRS